MREFSRSSFSSPLRARVRPARAGVVSDRLQRHERAVYPGATWTHVNSPESAGYSRDGLDSVRTILANSTTTGMMVVVGGRVLFEHGDLAQLSYIASARKSILSMLFGTYVASGKIRLTKTLAEVGLDDVGYGTAVSPPASSMAPTPHAAATDSTSR